jgi:hypothetical protein
MLEGDPASDPADLDLLASGARYLNAEFNRTNSDIVFADAVNWGLIKGCALVKQLWGFEGLEPWLVQPEQFGVLREDISDLDRQEAFVETTYMTKSAFARTLIDHPDKKDILGRVESTMTASKDGVGADDYLMQIIVGGTAPVSTTSSTGKAMVNFSSAPKPMLAPETLRRLVRLDELWVQDSERDDYTTIRMVQDIVIEGGDRHRNLGGVRGEHPYTKVCPNSVDGYFWGLSEIAAVYKLQELLNAQINKLQQVTALKADPPRALIGFTGMNQEKYNALRRPGGFISEDAPNAKIETLSPDVPQELLIERINATIQYFDDVSGFTPVMLGMGDQGVRSQAQAQTLARNSSPRMRDRALLVERQAVEFGEYSMKLLQAKEAEIMTTEEKQEYILAQLPKDYRTTIDSHTSSPAYQEDTRNLAIGLRKLGVIDDESTIMMVHPPHEDTLVLKARAKAKAQAQMIAQHPELLTKGKGGKK